LQPIVSFSTTSHARGGRQRSFVMDLLFVLAGVALLAHVALCALLQRRLREERNVLHELFATPNQALLGSSSFRLLRARYYLPWQGVPATIRSLDAGSRAILAVTRVTGLLVPTCSLAFLGLSMVQALA